MIRVTIRTATDAQTAEIRAKVHGVSLDLYRETGFALELRTDRDDRVILPVVCDVVGRRAATIGTVEASEGWGWGHDGSAVVVRDGWEALLPHQVRTGQHVHWTLAGAAHALIAEWRRA